MVDALRKFVPAPALSFYHFAWAFFSALWYRFPARKLTVIGVTGTNGKSSVVWLCARMLEGAGRRVAATSSIEFQIGTRRWENKYKMTMPGRGFHQRFLAQAVREGCTHAVLEVTSEGIAQHRHRFIGFDVAVFLNLSPEHIERHRSYDAYRAAKGKLFRSLSSSRGSTAIVVNLGEKEAGYFLQFPAGRYLGFRLASRKAQAELPTGGDVFVAENVAADAGGIRFSVGGTTFQSALLGESMVENALAAASTATAVGVSLQICAEALSQVTTIPGRLEPIENDRGLRIFVDYAHTPTALENVLKTVRPLGKKLVCVLGAAGGGRDKWKREEFGQLAYAYCNQTFVTDEDPYDEDPAAIRHAIVRGMLHHGGGAYAEDVADRRAAIRKALEHAEPGDVIIITGKGSEPWMMVAGGKKIPWDDRVTVREELAKLSRTDSESAKPKIQKFFLS